MYNIPNTVKLGFLITDTDKPPAGTHVVVQYSKVLTPAICGTSSFPSLCTDKPLPPGQQRSLVSRSQCQTTQPNAGQLVSVKPHYTKLTSKSVSVSEDTTQRLLVSVGVSDSTRQSWVASQSQWDDMKADEQHYSLRHSLHSRFDELMLLLLLLSAMSDPDLAAPSQIWT